MAERIGGPPLQRVTITLDDALMAELDAIIFPPYAPA
jgi:hypothetical protein